MSEKIRSAILQEGTLFPPPRHDASTLTAAGYKAAARTLVERVGELIRVPPQEGLHDLSRDTIGANLLPAVHALAHAGKVMIVTGRNTAEGKVTIDGPVSAAVAAHVLYESRKVAVIMCDAINQQLIQRLLEKINPACARYVKYLPINEVNGRLFGALSKHIVMQKPDVTLYIDLPGRNGSGDYVDETGRSIGMSNVAFDQALNLQNCLQMQTIAICRSANNAGMASSDTPVMVNGEDIRARLCAALPLVTADAIDGTLALMELVGNACTEMNACSPQQLELLLKTAIAITEDKAFTAPPMRRVGKPREPRPDGGQLTIASRSASMARLEQLQNAIIRRPLAWPASLDKLKFEGPEMRHIVLYDSSDGVLIATNDFMGYVRARSHFHLKVDLVADHNKASYGNWNKDELFHIVVDGMVFSAMLGPDVITLVCNTACTVDLPGRVGKIVEKCLQDAGKSSRMEIVDLIATASMAIAEEGGARPVLLSTEGTARSGKYEEAVKQAAHAQGLEEPNVKVIGCGDKEARPGLDWAALVNKSAHLDPDSTDYLILEQEVSRHVDQIALNATSIWLCCTHFPILMEMIRKALNKRLVAHNMPPDSIPIIDPLPYQAEATIAVMQRAKPTQRDYRKLPDISISTTGLPGKVMKAAELYTGRPHIPVINVVFPKVKIPMEEPQPQL